VIELNDAGPARHPLTLIFRDPAVERAYLAARAVATLPNHRPLFLIVLALWFSNAWLDILVYKLSIVQSLTIRGLGSAGVVALIGCASLPLDGFARWRERAGLFAVVAIGLGLLGITLAVPPMHDPHNAILLGLSYLLCMGPTIAGLRSRAAFAANAILVCAYAAVEYRLGVSLEFFGTNLFLLFNAVALGALVNYRVELSHRREFVLANLAEAARKQSDDLLHEVLPSTIARRLKANERPIADRHGEVTVLFADIVGFTTLSERLDASEVVTSLDEVFTAFDEIATRLGLEKIKTIGDAYMVAGGLPEARADHAETVATMALEMLEAIKRSRFSGGPVSMRIGIHTGPVVAGVIGKRKFLYDLWGDTVNTASRMESHSKPGTIQVTEATYSRLRDRFRFESCGPIEIKGKGPMQTFLLLGRA
jgi:class 3 adenylate cyclase